MSSSLHLNTKKPQMPNITTKKLKRKIDIPDQLLIKIFQIYLKQSEARADQHFVTLAAVSTHHLKLAIISMDLFLKKRNPKNHKKYSLFRS